jgi:hypothetical protein
MTGIALRFALLALLLALPATAHAEILIEATAYGEDLRIVVDRPRERVLIEGGGERVLVDHLAGTVRRSGAGGESVTHARFRPGKDVPPPYRLEPFGPGPIYAGHGSVYHVLFDQDRVCAELLLSAWMRPFLDPAVRALAILERLDGARTADPCQRVPITTLAAGGWPLLAGSIDRPLFATRSLRFDYRPAPGELDPPEQAKARPGR